MLLKDGSDLADQLTDLVAAYNLIGQDYLSQQNNPVLQQSASATPATPSSSASTSCKSNPCFVDMTAR